MILAQIIHELFLEKDDFEFVDKEELPSPYLEKVKEKSGMFKKVCQAAFLVQLNFQSVGKEDVKLRHS